jgi:hypothetical protein
VSEQPPTGFDPLALLAALEARQVAYVVIGGFAALVHGSGLDTHGVDITPSLRPENLERLQAALADLGARPPDGELPGMEALAGEPLTRLQTEHGELAVVPVPAGTRGYDDLRRGASREWLDSGLRPSVAGLGDVIRSLDALGREQDIQRLPRLRRLAELEHDLGHGL